MEQQITFLTYGGYCGIIVVICILLSFFSDCFLNKQIDALPLGIHQILLLCDQVRSYFFQRLENFALEKLRPKVPKTLILRGFTSLF